VDPGSAVDPVHDGPPFNREARINRENPGVNPTKAAKPRALLCVG